MSVVPGVKGSLSGVVVHHADVGVLVVEWDVSVLICGGIGVVGKMHLSPSQVGVSNIQGAADHKSLPRATFRKSSVPTLEDFQRARVKTTHLEKETDGLTQRANE